MTTKKSLTTKSYRLVEKKDHNALHGLFDSRETAERFLCDIIPVHVSRGYFMDKSLTQESFCVLPPTSFDKEAACVVKSVKPVNSPDTSEALVQSGVVEGVGVDDVAKPL